jgi:hypothetical protein
VEARSSRPGFLDDVVRAVRGVVRQSPWLVSTANNGRVIKTRPQWRRLACSLPSPDNSRLEQTTRSPSRSARTSSVARGQLVAAQQPRRYTDRTVRRSDTADASPFLNA